MKLLPLLLLLSLPLLSCSSTPDAHKVSSAAGSRKQAADTGTSAATELNDASAAAIISYTVDPRTQHVTLYWKDEAGRRLGSLGKLRAYVESPHARLLFAMNGGMFNPSFAPQGLYIENYQTRTPLDTLSGSGNFYLKPNGVFYITADNAAAVCTTRQFRSTERIRYATQSGPMLLINGQVHPAFRPGSTNRQIRNGVGILPSGKVVFAISRSPINFYDFAEYFRQAGCRNALYLDGFVSRMYLPEKDWLQTDGDFGVMIGVMQSVD